MNSLEPDHTWITCNRCGGVYHPVFYRQALTTAFAKYRRATCIGCETTERTQRAIRNRARDKARKALSRHATKYIQSGLVHSAKEFTERYGWTVERLTHDLTHTYENTCPYCWQPFAEMEHGLADISIDVVDPFKEPFYRTNTRWCCITCNVEKKKTPPELWETKLAMWRIWRSRMNDSMRPMQLGLFNDAERPSA